MHWSTDVKMDWCNTNINGTQLDPKVQYPEMSKALNHTGKPIFFNTCEWGKENPWEWMAPYANSWRTGSDHKDDWKSTSSVIEHNAGLAKYPGRGGWNDWDFLMTGDQVTMSHARSRVCPLEWVCPVATKYSNVMVVFLTQGCLVPIPGKFCPGQTDAEYRTEFSMWVIGSSSLIVASDVRNLTSLQKEVCHSIVEIEDKH